MLGGKILCKQTRFALLSAEVCYYEHKYREECFHLLMLVSRSPGKLKSPALQLYRQFVQAFKEGITLLFSKSTMPEVSNKLTNTTSLFQWNMHLRHFNF